MKDKLFVNEEELINKGVKEGLNRIATNSDIAVYIDSQINKNNSNTNNKTIEIKRLIIITDNNKIFINPNTINFYPRMSDNILPYCNRYLYLDEHDIGNTSIQPSSFVSKKYYYYYNSTTNIFILINIVKTDNIINPKFLFGKNNILNSFYLFLDNKSKQIYDKIIFPILDKNKQNYYNEEEATFNIKVKIKDNVVSTIFPDNIFKNQVFASAKCHPEDKFDLKTGLKIALNRALETN